MSPSNRFANLPLIALALTLLLMCTAASAARWCPDVLAQAGAPTPAHRGEWSLSPFTHHWRHNPEHRPVFLLSLEEHLPGDRFCGLGVFSNSFGQPSAYLYAGQTFPAVLGVPELFVKLSAGILYGYVAPYEDKVPLNREGFSPAIVPTLGYQLSRQDALQVHILGNAGVMFAYGRRF